MAKLKHKLITFGADQQVIYNKVIIYSDLVPKSMVATTKGVWRFLCKTCPDLVNSRFLVYNIDLNESRGKS